MTLTNALIWNTPQGTWFVADQHDGLILSWDRFTGLREVHRPESVPSATDDALKYLLASVATAYWLCQWHPTSIPFKA